MRIAAKIFAGILLLAAAGLVALPGRWEVRDIRKDASGVINFYVIDHWFGAVKDCAYFPLGGSDGKPGAICTSIL